MTCAGALLLAAYLSLALRPWEIRDADVFWHLATGRWILQHRTLPQVDVFSYTMAGQPWLNHEWLFQVILRLVQVAAGTTGLYLLKSLLYTAALLLPAVVWLQRTTAAGRCNAPLLVAALMLCILPALPFSEYRPLCFSVFFLAGAAELADRPASSARWPFVAGFLLFAVWANMHATFFLGLVATGCFLALSACRTRIALLLGVEALATLLNPHGWRLWHVPFKVGGSALFMSANQEWRPPDFTYEFWAFWLAALLLLAVWFSLGKAAFTARHLFALALLLGAFKSRRIIPYFTVALVAPLLHGLPVLAQKFTMFQRTKVAWAATAFLLVCGTGWAIPVVRPLGKLAFAPPRLPYLANSFPGACADALTEAAQGSNVFNDYNHGGYLHYAVGPAWKVFMDGRNDLYGERLTLAYNQVALAQGQWRQALEATSTTAVLCSYDMVMPRPNLALELAMLPAHWALVEFDDAGMLFVRRDAVTASYLALHEYRHVKPMLLYDEQLDFVKQAGTLEAWRAELRRRVERGPASRIASHLLAEALADANRPNEAARILKTSVDIFGEDASSERILDRITSINTTRSKP